MKKLTSSGIRKYATYFFILIIIALVAWLFSFSHPPQEKISYNDSSEDLNLNNKTPEISKQRVLIQEAVKSNKDIKTTTVSQLSEVIKQDADTNYIVSCESKTPTEDSKLEELQEYFYESQEKASTQLNELRTEQSDFMQLIISDDLNNIEKITQLKRYLKNNPSNKLAHWHLLQSCSSNEGTNHDCDPGTVSDAIASNPENGALWINVAILRNKNDDIEGALSALQQLIETPTFDMQYSRHIELFESVISNSGRGSNMETKINAFGYAAAVSAPQFTDIINFCKEQSISRPDISQLCLRVGHNLSQNGKTYLTNLIGFALQKSMYELVEDEENLAKTLKERDESDYYKFSKLRKKAEALLDYDEILLNDHFQHLKIYGENIAYQYLMEEAVRLSKNPDYNPCPKDK